MAREKRESSEQSGQTNGSHNGSQRGLPIAVNGKASPVPEGESAYVLKRGPDGARLERAAKPGAANRRRHERVAWQHHHLDPLTLEVEEPGLDWRQVPCTLVDLAAGGIGILVAEPLDPGSRVRVTFPLPPSVQDTRLQLETLAVEPWSAMAEVVHARHVPDHAHDHVPPTAHLPHHRGARFSELEGQSELRLLRALYGPLPAGWAVEQYRVRRAGTATAGSAKNGEAVPRYAVIRDGKRVAQGFSTYERARARAISIHLDDVAVARRGKSRDQ